MYPTLISQESITVYFPGVGPKVVLKSSANYQEVRQALNDGRYNDLLELMDPCVSITKWGHGSLTVKDGIIHVDGEPLVSEGLNKKVLAMWEEGFPIDPFIAFDKELKKLTSHRISTGLFEYLERHSFPLFPDGTFMAYKGLKLNPYKGTEVTEELAREVFNHSPQNPYTYINGQCLSDIPNYMALLSEKDYLDVHSASVPQSIGDTVSMDTRHVNDDSMEGCSTGLHVGSESYTTTYDTRTLVRVSPINVVSVPYDCGFSKIRVDKYTLVEVDITKKEYTSSVYTVSEDYEDEYDDDEDYDDSDE